MNLTQKFALPIVAACLYFSAAPAQATVTLQFSLAGVGRATGFSDSAGLAGVNGMRWSVVIDTSGNGFTPGTYDGGFSINSSGFLTVAGVATDDYYFANPAATLTSTSTTTGGDPGGSGTITAIAGVPYGIVDGLQPLKTVDVGDPFALIWFESNAAAIGNKYGLLENQVITQQFDIPADGGTNSYASNYFINPTPATQDPIKPTNLTFQNPVGVPEPSRLVLLGLGGLGLILRRRRC